MSGIGKAVSKVFKSVGNIVKKVWKPLVVAAAIYFSGGLALGAMGVIGGGATGLAGAAAGLSSAAGAIGIGGGAAAAEGLGAGAADVGAGMAGTAADDALGSFAFGDTAAPAIAGGTDAVTAAASSAPGYYGAATGGLGVASPSAASIASNGVSGMSAASSVGAPSSLWDTSLGVAKSVLSTPGVPSLISGVAQGLMAGNLQNAQMKWQEAHAPGQIAGGAGNAWGGFAQNKNLTPTTPMPTSTQLPALQPYHQAANQATAPAMPGINQPGSNSANYPGYGTPGYGQQFPPGTGPYGTQPLAAVQPGMMPQDQYQQQGLLSQQTPFIESPYDESYV